MPYLFKMIAIGIMFGTICLDVKAQEDKIVAIVGKEVITNKDVERFLNMVYFRLSQELKGSDLEKAFNEEKKHALENLINNKLLLYAAKKRKLQPDSYWVEKRLNMIKSQYPSEEALLEDLKSRGLTLKTLKERIRDQLLIEFMIQENVRSKIRISPLEITSYYQKHKQDFKTPWKFRLFFRKFPTREEALCFYEKEKINLNIADFEDFGLRSDRELIPKLKTLFITSSIPSLLEPVEIEGFFYVFFIKEKVAPHTLPLEEVKEDIYHILYRKHFDEQLKIFLNKIKKEVFVKVYD